GLVERVGGRPQPAGGDRRAAMSTPAVTTLIMWDDELLRYDLGEHPLNPVRVELTIALARELGVFDRPGVTVAAPQPADDATLRRVHDPAYLDAVQIGRASCRDRE